MRIGQLCYGLNIGGVQKVALNLSNALAARGHTVFYLFRVDGPLRRYLDPRVGAVQYASGFPTLQDISGTWLMACRLASIFRALQLDLVHAHDILSWAVGATAGRLARVPVLRTQHNFVRVYERLNARTLRWLPFERWTRLFHCIFRATGEDLALAGVNRSKIVIESGVWKVSRHVGKAAARAQNGVSESDRIVITVGRLVEGKGWELVPRIAQGVCQSVADVRFWIVGNGPLRTVLERSVRELGLQEAVQFLGERPDVDDLYSAADVALFPAHSHAGMVEAAAFVPVVAGRGLCQEEYIVDGKTGILCDHEDIDSYTAALIHLLQNDSLREQYTKASQELFDQYFSVDQGILRLLEHYSQVT